MTKTTAIGNVLLATIVFGFCAQSHGHFDLTLEFDSIEPIGASESFDIFATLTNEPTSTETLALASDDTILFTFSIGTSGPTTEFPYEYEYLPSNASLFDVLSSANLAPGDSVEGYWLTLTPRSPLVPLGNYELDAVITFGRNLASPPIQGGDVSSSVIFTVVPEPDAAIPWCLALGIAGIPMLARRKPSSHC